MPTGLYFVFKYFSFTVTPQLERHSFITTQIILSLSRRYNRVRLYMKKYVMVLWEYLLTCIEGQQKGQDIKIQTK
jgi:hypothetical protein